MKQILLILSILIILNISIISAQDLGTFKQNQCVQLRQTCSNCTFINITSVVSPQSSILLSNVVMTKSGTDYNRTFCDTVLTGTYTYNTVGDLDGVNQVQSVNFNITPSGNSTMYGLYILIVVIFLIGFYGFFGKNAWVSVLGGLAMIGLGLFTINNGIDVYRNSITDIFSWVTIGLGAIFGITAGVELIEENL